jgi:hypothetical protein
VFQSTSRTWCFRVHHVHDVSEYITYMIFQSTSRRISHSMASIIFLPCLFSYCFALFFMLPCSKTQIVTHLYNFILNLHEWTVKKIYFIILRVVPLKSSISRTWYFRAHHVHGVSEYITYMVFLSTSHTLCFSCFFYVLLFAL